MNRNEQKNRMLQALVELTEQNEENVYFPVRKIFDFILERVIRETESEGIELSTRYGIGYANYPEPHTKVNLRDKFPTQKFSYNAKILEELVKESNATKTRVYLGERYYHNFYRAVLGE